MDIHIQMSLSKNVVQNKFGSQKGTVREIWKGKESGISFRNLPLDISAEELLANSPEVDKLMAGMTEQIRQDILRTIGSRAKTAEDGTI